MPYICKLCIVRQVLNIVISVRVSYMPARRSKAMRVRYVRAACPCCIERRERERERERRRRTREVHIRVSELRARTISWFMMHKHDVSASTRGSIRNLSASHYNNRKNNVQFTRGATDTTIKSHVSSCSPIKRRFSTAIDTRYIQRLRGAIKIAAITSVSI
uniref:Uncharacterized protein n=1 Tax=Trichogramma kaykai TaxID=54128 RepID=A0ABD2X171_9HYME